jgi:hypothetical protein
MNDRPTAMARTDDDWLDAALRAEGREHRAGYVDDAGFTARVMAALPAPAMLPAWRRPARAALWVAAGVGIALALPGTAFDAIHDIGRVVLGQRVSLSGIAVTVTALGMAAWAATATLLRHD